MNNFLPPPRHEVYRYKRFTDDNALELMLSLLDEIKISNEARINIVREIIEDTFNLRINVFEKLALHFSKEAMYAERMKEIFLELYDRSTAPPRFRK